MVAPIRRRETTGQRVTTDPESGQDLRRRVRTHSRTVVNDFAPARTATTATSNNDVSVWRTARGSRGSGTRVRYSARPGHCPASSEQSPERRFEICSRADRIREDDKARTDFYGDHGIRHPHDLGSRACAAPDLAAPARKASTVHHATLPGPCR
jgi:hypothetical protein